MKTTDGWGRFLWLFRPYQGRLLRLGAVIVAAAGAEAIGLILLAALLHQLGAGGASKQASMLVPVYVYAQDNPGVFLLLLGVTYIGRSLLALWITYGSCSLALRVTDDWRTRLIHALFHMPVRRLDQRHGAMLQLILDEPTNVGFGLSAVGLLAQNVLSAVTIYVVLMSLSPLITVGLTVMAGASIATVWMISRYSRRIAVQRSQVFSEGYAYVAEMLSAIKQLRLFDLETQAKDRAKLHVDQMRGIQLRASVLASSPRLLVEIVFLFGLAGLLAVLWPRLGEASALSAVGLAVVAALRLLPSFSTSAGTWVVIQQAWPAIIRISQELASAESTTGDEACMPARRPVTFQERIQCQDVHFSYPGRDQALAGLDIEIPWGSFVAVVGPSGAGKSTLVDLLCGFYEPDKGEVLVDGVDLRRGALSHWRRQLGVVSQDAFLFSGTIRENLCLLRPDCPELLLQEVVALVGADGFIRGLPQGYETRIGERGLSLSGGQRQRLALARVLVREPRLLILDEATSALDVESEEALQQGLERLRQRLTMLVIAHRLSTVRRADRIYVVGGGKVVESGRHDDLLRSGGLYAGMWRTAEAGLAK